MRTIVNPSTRQSELRTWFEGRRWARAEEAPFSIAIQCADGATCSEISSRVADYLSEVHAGSQHGWLFFDANLLHELDEGSNWPELVEAFPEASPTGGSAGSERPPLLRDIAHIGGAVLAIADARATLGMSSDLFVVSLRSAGPGAVEVTEADITLDLSRINVPTAVRVIADSALEWAASRTSPAA